MSITEANRLINKYVKLRNKIRSSDNNKLMSEFKKQQKICIDKFRYLVAMKTSRYKNFNNYDDLNQEGLEALLQALNSYEPNRGNWFWWAHKYIDTRISRSANLHTTIRFPLKYAKNNTPHREASLPVLVDQMQGPHDLLEQKETFKTISANFENLSENQQKVAQLIFGMNGEDPQSISKVCKKLHISRPACIKIVDQVIGILKKNIQL